MVNFRVIRNRFQQIPMSDMSLADILIPLHLRLLPFKYLFKTWPPEMPLKAGYLK